MAYDAHVELDRTWMKLAEGHGDELDVCRVAQQFSLAAGDYAERLTQFAPADIGSAAPTEEFSASPFRGPRTGGLGLLRDLHEIYLMVTECDLVWTLIEVGAQGTRDAELLQLSESGLCETKRQLDWLRSRMKQAAPQALVVAD
jgi:hypothetical protein